MLGLRAWIDARPYSAIGFADRADDLGASAAIDEAALFFLRAGGAVLKPDFEFGRRVLAARSATEPESQVARLLWSTHLIYSGEIEASRLLVTPLLGEATRAGTTGFLAPLAACAASITSSMLDDETRAAQYLQLARELESPSAIVDAAADHLRSIAATQLRPVPLRDEGRAGYASAARKAREIDFRLLELVATYRLAHETDKPNRAEFMHWLARQLDGDHPVEGVPALMASMGKALGEQNLAALLALVTRLSNADLIHDAKVLATRLMADSARRLSGNAHRLLARLVAHRFGGARPAAPTAALLTEAERDVARLVLAGISDREIGERTGRSRRTVSTHVGRILLKLDLQSRRQLTPELARRHGVDVDVDAQDQTD